MLKFYAAILLAVLMLPIVAFGFDIPIIVPEGDPLATLLHLVANWSTSSPLILGSVGITLVVQVLKRFVPNFQYLRPAVAFLGVTYGVVLAVAQGMGLPEAVVAAVFVSGGAVAIYEALKPAFKKIGL